MITYEDIKKANEQIRLTDIKGKEYAEVAQRIKAFRMVYPQGGITTHMLQNDPRDGKNNTCIIRAIVTDGEGHELGTGTAYETEGNSYINRTSYIENCETSAVGRALGMAGFGLDTAVASAEEQQNAELQQTAIKPINNSQVKAIRERAREIGLNEEAICKKYEIESLEKMPTSLLAKCNQDMDKFEKSQGEKK